MGISPRQPSDADLSTEPVRKSKKRAAALAGFVALFVAAFAMMLWGRRGGGGREPQYWRGKQIEYRQPSMGDLARRWFGSRGRKR